MKASGNRSGVLLLVLVGVAIAAFYYRGATFRQLFRKATGQPADAAAAAAGITSKTYIRVSNEWLAMHPDPEGADLMVLSARDISGNHFGYSYEVGDFTSRLVQGIMFAAGRPVSVARRWNTVAAFDRRGIKGLRLAAIDEEYGLVKVCRELKIPRAVYVELDGGVTTGTTARAVAVDAQTSSVIGTWTTSIPDPMSAETSMEVQVKLAPMIAAGLLGLPGSEQLLGKLQSEARANTNAAALAALHPLQVPPSTSHSLYALRNAEAALHNGPTNAAAWRTYVRASHRVTFALAPLEEEQYKMEGAMRTAVAGEIASMLEPDTSASLYARVLGRTSLARSGAARTLLLQLLDKQPSDTLAFAFLAAVERRSHRITPLTAPPEMTAEDEDLWNYLPLYARLRANETADMEALLAEWLKQAPWAAEHYNSLGDHQFGRHDIGYARIMHAGGAMTGIIQGFIEAARQCTLHGNAAAGERLGQSALQLLGSKSACKAGGTGASAADDLADCLNTAYEKWSRSGLPRDANASAFLPPGSPGRKFITAWSEARKVYAEALGSKESIAVRPRGSGLELSPTEYIGVASGPARLGAARAMQSVLNVAPGREVTENVARFLYEKLPYDIPPLFAVATYYRNQLQDHGTGDPILARISSFDYVYPPLKDLDIRAYTGPAENRLPVIRDHLRQYPFNWSIQNTMVNRLSQVDQYAEAADILDYMHRTFYPDFASRVLALYYRAMSQERLVTAAEVEELDHEIPDDEVYGDIYVAQAWRNSSNLQKAAEAYKRGFDKTLPVSVDSYTLASYISQCLGDTTGAVSILRRYLEKDPQSLRAAQMLLDISAIEEGAGNLEAARKAHAEAADIDNWMTNVMRTGAWLLWRDGKTTEAFTELDRIVDRYPGDASYASLGQAHYASRNTTGAREVAMKGLQRAGIYGYQCRTLLTRLDLQAGDPKSAERRLIEYVTGDYYTGQAHTVVSHFYRRMGNLAKAQEFADKAVELSSPQIENEAEEALVEVQIARAEYEKAAKLLKRMRLRNPVSDSVNVYEAKMLLAQGKLDEALAALEIPLRTNDLDGMGVAAKVHLARGAPQQALDLIRRAAARTYIPRYEWKLIEGNALAALGDIPGARTAWHECLFFDGSDSIYGKQAIETLATH